jgi:hypothetical protein
MLFVFSTTVVHALLYWGFNGMTLVWGHFGLFEKYRIERTSREVPNRELFLRTLRDAAVGQFIIGPFTLYFLYDVYKWCGMPDMQAPLPPASTLFAFFLGGKL